MSELGSRLADLLETMMVVDDKDLTLIKFVLINVCFLSCLSPPSKKYPDLSTANSESMTASSLGDWRHLALERYG